MRYSVALALSRKTERIFYTIERQKSCSPIIAKIVGMLKESDPLNHGIALTYD